MNNASIAQVADDSITAFYGGAARRLRPVPMATRPRDDPAAWLRFQGAHVPGTQMSESMAAQLQMFMRVHRTEAVTDGKREYTLAGNMLALCDTTAVQ